MIKIKKKNENDQPYSNCYVVFLRPLSFRLY